MLPYLENSRMEQIIKGTIVEWSWLFLKVTTNSQTHQLLRERGKHQIPINYGWLKYLQQVDKLALMLPQEGKRS